MAVNRSRAAVAGWRGMVVGGLICVGAQFAQAEDVAVSQPATPELEAVVVTASRTATGLGETPAAITRLENDAIADSKPRLISDVIDRVPGVHMVDLGNEQHSMSIRQPITTGALYQYLEDNIPIRPLGVFNHNALNEINFAGVDSVEVMRGPTSSLYGSNAVGGAVNFLSAAPSLTPEAWAGLRGSDQGYGRVDAGASGTEGDLGARLSYYRSEVNDGWREYGDGDKDSLSARVDYVLSDYSLVKTVGSYTNMYTDMSGTLGESDYQNNPEKSYQTFTERTDINSRISS
ncbi:MAG: TonB-dependent receptor plug domain-containing protein, partial [Gammaproteobacteria bacterium]|nr:TonB-dependent receptor plug domain-containing protein [Gammaproteobacteria bacterium]